MSESADDPSLDQLRELMRRRGVSRLLVKFLSPNDNSKNQIYFGGDLGVVNILPAGEPQPATSGSLGEPIFKAPLEFSWLDVSGHAFAAPHAQLILYPQYPEVRFSGFLRGAEWAPSAHLTVRDEGRVLLLGIGATNAIVGYVAGPESSIAKELQSPKPKEQLGIFHIVAMRPLPAASDSRARLLSELCRIHRSGWIQAWRLQQDGGRKPCNGTNCIGVTLESELGILSNGRADPDFEGWEVKAHSVANLNRPGSGAVTLMTPEPTAGFYRDNGVEAFVRRYGYPDKLGRPDRLNFGGVHVAGVKHRSTGLTLMLDGFDHATETLLRADGSLALVDDRGIVAAAWPFAKLLAHWQRKHTRAAYFPGKRSTGPLRAYAYGGDVMLCEGTDFLRLLVAIADGRVYYDPGIKLENASGTPVMKRRSQLRIKMSNVRQLYHTAESMSVC